MKPWLASISRALDARATPLMLFFRDDDAGWADERLFELVALFEQHEMPLDLAVIPQAIETATGARLAQRARLSGLLAFHQHGFLHANHERDGRPCEFGRSRDAHLQRADIERGRERLLRLFGPQLDPIFTPPWNRCTPATGRCLVDAGLAVLSRDTTAGCLSVAGLAECPIASDWLQKRKGVPITRDEWAASFGELARDAAGPVGLMLHHAVMDADNRAALGRLLATLRSSGRVHAMSMAEAAGQLPVSETERSLS